VAEATAGAAVGTTIAKLLDAARATDFTNLKCEFSKGFASPSGSVESLTVLFYRAALSGARHNFTDREDAAGKRYRRPMVVDLYYWLTAWSADASNQVTYLLWAMRTIEDLGEFSGNSANFHYGTANPPFRDGETVQLMLDAVSLQDQVNIWERGKSNMQPGFGVIVRGIPIDSSREIVTGPEVQIRKISLSHYPDEVRERA
jgi:Pvc16 N-terminal domain